VLALLGRGEEAVSDQPNCLPKPPRSERIKAVREETIKKKSKQLLTALGAIAVLVVVLLAWDGSLGDDAGGLILGLLLIGLYILPIIIAAKRKHPQILPIVLINLLLGWTILGWIGALIWSVAAFRREVTEADSTPRAELR